MGGSRRGSTCFWEESDMEGVRSYRMGCFVWRDEERVVGFMDWMWRWMGVIGMDGSDGCVELLCRAVCCCCVWCCVCVCVLCVECLSIQEESTPFDEPQPTPPHHTPTITSQLTHLHTPTHTTTHHTTPNPPPIPNPPTTLTPPQQHPTTTRPPLYTDPNNQWSSPSQDY